MNQSVFCTIWIKNDEDDFTGTFSGNGGLLEAGQSLKENYCTEEAVKRLILSGAKETIGNSMESCKNYENGSEIIFKNLTYELMKQVARKYTCGAYAYIYDISEGEWMLGVKMKTHLKDALN